MLIKLSNRYFNRVIFCFSLLFLSQNVLAEAVSVCSKVSWVEQFSDTKWSKTQKKLETFEVFNAVIYVNTKKEQRLSVDVYNSVLQGRVDVIKRKGVFYAIFSYQVHFDTIEEKHHSSTYVSAIYAAQSLEKIFYCSELTYGEKDIAKVVANDILRSVVDIANKNLL